MEYINEDTEPLIHVERRGRKPLYPWDEWLRHNKPVRLVEGADFTCRLSSLRQQAFTQAANRHGSLSTHTGVDLAGNNVLELTFQFSAQYLAKMERIEREGDRAMAVHSAIAAEEVDDFDFPTTTSRQKELTTELIDDPTNRNGAKWGPPQA
jgi:hypothetical protein